MRDISRLVRRSQSVLNLGLVIIGFLQISPAQACQFSIETPQAVRGVYDPFSATPLTVDTTIQLKFIGGADRCASAVSIQTVQNASTDLARSMHFQILDSGGAAVFDSSQPHAQPLLIGQGAPLHAALAIPFSIKAPTGQILGPGLYSMPIILTPVAGSDAKRTPAGPPVTLPVIFTVAPSLSVNIAGGGQSTTLDFDVLTLGAVRAVSLQGRSNQRFSIIASSDNGGVLRLNATPGQGDWKVPYTIRLGANAGVSLSAGKTAKLIQQPTPATGAVTSLEVTIGDPAHQRAGRYKDVITVQVATEP